jgi:hypothetical protein
VDLLLPGHVLVQPDGGLGRELYRQRLRQLDAGQASGTKYHDLDADGVIDAGEPGLGGWTFYVDYNGNETLDTPAEPSAVSAAGGAWEITGIRPGTWTIREVSQTGWTCSVPGTCSYSRTLVSNGSSTGNDFANWTTGSISGTKFHDTDNDGSQREATEPGLAGSTFRLFRDNGTTAGVLDAGDFQVASTESAADGAFSFSGLTPGRYLVCEVVRSGWILSFPGSNTICAFDGSLERAGYAVTVTSGADSKLGPAGNGYTAGQSSFGNTTELFGCTPGYWKNHTDRWGPTGYTPSTTLASVFGANAPAGTLLQAFDFVGGSGTTGGKQILMRAAVASLLNFAHPDVAYSVPARGALPAIGTTSAMISAVTSALGGTRTTMINLAAQLDAANNAINSCPLTGTRAYKGT